MFVRFILKIPRVIIYLIFKADLPILLYGYTGYIVISVWFIDYGIRYGLFKRCHVLGQEFVQKCENVETDINKGFKVIYRVNKSY